MITFNSYNLNNRNVSFGTTMGLSAKRAIRKLYKGQEIPKEVKNKIKELKNDGIKAKITATTEGFYAKKKAFGINKNGRFGVALFKFIVNVPRENKKLWLISTNDPTTFKTLFPRFKIITDKMPSWKEVTSICRDA